MMQNWQWTWTPQIQQLRSDEIGRRFRESGSTKIRTELLYAEMFVWLFQDLDRLPVDVVFEQSFTIEI